MGKLVQGIYLELLLVRRNGIVVLLLRLVRQTEVVVCEFVKLIDLNLFLEGADGFLVLAETQVGASKVVPRVFVFRFECDHFLQ